MAQSCSYNGQSYSDGSTVCQNGETHRCDDGSWTNLHFSCNSLAEGMLIHDPAKLQDVSNQLSMLFLTNSERTTAPATTKYGGTAKCTVVKEDGTKQQVECSVSGSLTYQDARTTLELKLNGEVKNYPKSHVEGSISFEIKREL